MALDFSIIKQDPMGGLNRGMSRLSDAFEYMQRRQDQEPVNRLNQLKLAEAQREAEQGASLRSLLQNPPSQTTFAAPQQQTLASLGGIGQGMGLQPDASLTNIQGRNTQTPERTAYEFYKQNDPMKAKAYAEVLTTEAERIARLGDHEGAFRYLNASLGTNYQYMGSKNNVIQVKKDDGTIDLVDANTFDIIRTIGGTTKPTPDSSGFQSAIAGLTGPSASGTKYPLGNTGINTGFAPLPETEKDIRLAGADYNAKSEDIDKAVDNARSYYEKQKIQGQPVKVGKTTMTPEYNLLGDRKDEGKGVTVITPPMPKPEKDLPAGVQEKLQSKLEMYTDWNGLKQDFKPEYMPTKPFKTVGEFQINLNKIFANNPEAADWWTRYFDARNVLLKDRSGAAVVEGEFKRFEQGSISANTDPTLVTRYLDRSVKKYRQHTDAYLKANKKNHPEAVKAFEDAFGYGPEVGTATPQKGKPSGKPITKNGKSIGDFWGK